MSANAQYGIGQIELIELLEARRKEEAIEKLSKLGGVTTIVKNLNSSELNGLSGEESDLKERRECFGPNKIPPTPSKTFLQLAFEASQDFILIVLMVAAAVSVGLSFYTGPSKLNSEGKQ